MRTQSSDVKNNKHSKRLSSTNEMKCEIELIQFSKHFIFLCNHKHNKNIINDDGTNIIIVWHNKQCNI